MRFAPALLPLFILTACGIDPSAPADGSGHLGFDLYLSRAAVEDIGAFQIALVRDGSAYDCAQLQQRCLIESVPREALVQFEDAEGRKHVALVVPAALSSEGTTRTQDLVLRNVPAGKNYLLVVEALSKTNPPRFIGASCTPRVDVGSGTNERETAQPIVLSQFPPADGGIGTDCDPRYEK